MNKWKENALLRLKQLEPEYAETCQWIFDHPELGFQEFQSSQKLQDFLASHGFRVEAGVAGMPTAFRAEYGSGSPKIGLICEYDALPDVGHACGHNIIGTGSAAAAIAAACALEDLPGSIVVLGSPCEEGRGAGKQILLENGFLDDLDCAMMFHPGPKTILSEPTYAVSLRRYVFHGKSARSMTPELGRNAMDAAVQMIVGLNALRHYLEKTVHISGVITKGGTTPQIIPDLCETQVSFRARSTGQLLETAQRVENCAKAAALATGCTVEISEIGRTYDDIKPSPTLVNILDRNMNELGYPVDIKFSGVPFAATDMGNVSQHIPAIHPILSLGVEAAHHSAEFAAACTGENAVLLTRIIGQSLALTAIDLLSEPSLLAQAKAELAESSEHA